MSYNPDITAAKREAKLRARTTGASYQSMLEEVARQAGAPNWSSFVARPVPLGPTAHNPSEKTPINQGQATWRRWRFVIFAALIGLICIAIGNFLIGLNAGYGFRSQQERNAAPKMVFAGMPGFLGDRSYPYYVQQDRDGELEAVVIFLDVRTTPLDPARLHARMMSMLTTGQTRQKWTYLSHGLSRFIFAVDCRGNTIKLRRRENTDWYVGTARHSYPNPGSKPIRLSTDTMRELCSPAAKAAVGRIVKATTATNL